MYYLLPTTQKVKKFTEFVSKSIPKFISIIWKNVGWIRGLPFMNFNKLEVKNKNTNLYCIFYILFIRNQRKNWLPNKYRFRPFSSLIVLVRDWLAVTTSWTVWLAMAVPPTTARPCLQARCLSATRLPSSGIVGTGKGKFTDNNQRAGNDWHGPFQSCVATGLPGEGKKKKLCFDFCAKEGNRGTDDDGQ
jgi:hypothetical protein